jgi:hypothetical protein
MSEQTPIVRDEPENPFGDIAIWVSGGNFTASYLYLWLAIVAEDIRQAGSVRLGPKDLNVVMQLLTYLAEPRQELPF